MKGGNGQLESERKFGDFVLQTEVFSNGQHLNSGIFFRCIPGQFLNGYECQIQNGFKDGDRTQPLDCGTGGFYRRQNARRVMADDFTWFPLTLVVAGNHMAAWVNGYPVSDWTDTRAANENPRQGLRTRAGHAGDSRARCDDRLVVSPPAGGGDAEVGLEARGYRLERGRLGIFNAEDAEIAEKKKKETKTKRRIQFQISFNAFSALKTTLRGRSIDGVGSVEAVLRARHWPVVSMPQAWPPQSPPRRLV